MNGYDLDREKVVLGEACQKHSFEKIELETSNSGLKVRIKEMEIEKAQIQQRLCTLGTISRDLERVNDALRDELEKAKAEREELRVLVEELKGIQYVLGSAVGGVEKEIEKASMLRQAVAVVRLVGGAFDAIPPALRRPEICRSLLKAMFDKNDDPHRILGSFTRAIERSAVQ